MPWLMLLVIAARTGALWPAEDEKALEKKTMEIAGTAEFLRGVPKHFATLKAVDAANRRVTLLIEGETLAKVWPLAPDAEIKAAGFWARLSHLQLGDRVWVWFKTDRRRQPVAISMLADELSEQDMHGPGVAVEARDGMTLTLKPADAKGKAWSVKTDKAMVFRGREKAEVDGLQPGARVYVQSRQGSARLVLDADAMALRREQQKESLRKLWETEGLPGTVAFAHVFSGEMDLLLDHEAMRWGRSLKTGDEVSLQASPPIKAVVKHVAPWRERTQLRLVINSFDLADLANGQRVRLKMAAPPEDVQSSAWPPDLDQPRTKPQRIEWFLASIYCTCKIMGDGCTGHFYTLASCNPNACGMPNNVRQTLSQLIDQGLTDRQILEQLLNERGPDLLRPHLLP